MLPIHIESFLKEINLLEQYKPTLSEYGKRNYNERIEQIKALFNDEDIKIEWNGREWARVDGIIWEI